MKTSLPKLDGVLETALYVDDMERSVQFYQKIFGFQVIDAFGRGSALSVCERQVLLIFKKRASPDHDGSGQLHLAFAIPASELNHWEQWLTENGIAIEQRRTWTWGGQSVYFRDPDGHLLELATPGVWSIY